MTFHRGWLIALLLIFSATAVLAQSDAKDPPVPIEQVKGKTGEFLVTVGDKNPLSKLADIQKRMGLKLTKGDEYDISKEVFDIVIPQAPGDDGKYGVMVSMSFPGHQWPPKTWRPILESRHMIWIGVQMINDPRSIEQHVGLLIDAAYNAKKTWPVDDERLYLNTEDAWERPIAGTAFYYPDVFAGTIIPRTLSWFSELKDPHDSRLTWPMNHMPRPLAPQWALDRQYTRFYLALLKDGSADEAKCNDVILYGYHLANFANVKVGKFPADDMNLYINFKVSPFEAGVEYLDSSMPHPTSRPATRASSPTTKPPESTGANLRANPQ